MQPGLVGVLGVPVMYVVSVLALGTKKDTKVAYIPEVAGAIVLGRTKILILVVGEEVRDITYFTCSKSRKMCTYFVMLKANCLLTTASTINSRGI